MFKLINKIIINKKFIINSSKKKDINEIYLKDEFSIEDKNEKIKNKKIKKNKNKEKEKEIKESQKKEKNIQISNIEDIININFIQKYIDLLFYMSEIGISFSFRKLVKISNLMLVKDIRIRTYFITKIHNSLIKIRKSHRNLTRLYSIMLLGLSDPNDYLEKQCKEIFMIFLDLLKIKLIKYENYLNSDGYIYIPEIYIFYLIIFFIFNDNLNINYQYNLKNNNNKYFMNIFGNYLKEIKKKFGFIDSTFLLKVLNEMKKYDCKNIKKIKCLESENVFLKNDILDEEENEGEDESKVKIIVNFDKVKNSIIDNIMSIVYNSYLSDEKRTDKDGNGIFPQIPNILTGKDVEFKDNYLFNFYNLKNNNVQNEQKNNEFNNNSNNFNSSKKTKENYYTNNNKDNKRFSFNEYFKEENYEDD